VNRPRLLDLFAGEGGSAYGYHLAGFDVTAVDDRDRPARAPGVTWVTADATTYRMRCRSFRNRPNTAAASARTEKKET
jgi:hypothetical protein